MELLKRKRKPLVIFDMDDILWDFNSAVMEKLKIPGWQDRIRQFNINKCPISEEEKQMIFAEYQNPENFKGIRLYAGAFQIPYMRHIGFHVAVESNCANSKIADYKTECLLENGIFKEKDIHMNIMQVGSHFKKNTEGAFAFVDDALPHIAESMAMHNYVLNKAWNIKNVEQVPESLFVRANLLESIISDIITKRHEAEI